MVEERRVTAAACASPDELLKAALDYAAQGWPVFPLHTPKNGRCDCPARDGCDSPGKHPRTRNGLSDATTEELQIRRWWRQWPIANIGLAVPTGYVVIDVDSERGFNVLRNEGKPLTSTAVQVTGGGTHYVYRTLNRIASRSKLVPDSEKGAHDGVDVRGPGGYILGEPSLHPSGQTYRWEIPLADADIAPPWVEDLAHLTGGVGDGERAPVDFGVLLAGLPEGQRKWEIYRAASKLRAADVPLDLAVRLALEAAAHCQPPLEAKEAERKVREAYAKYPPNASPRDLPAGVTLLGTDSVMVEFETARFVFSDLEKSGRELHAEMEVMSLLPGFPQEPYIQRLNLLSMSARDQSRREIEHVLGNPVKGQWTALLARAVAKAQQAYLSVDRSKRMSQIEAPDTLEFVIPDVAVDDGFSIIFGAGSAGKTFLLLSAALAVSRGDMFLGRQCQKRNVLYIDCETREKTSGYRMRRICAGLGLDLSAARDVHYWWTEGIPLEDQIDAIKRCCEDNQIGFVCLDHIAAACAGDASEQSVASRFARAVGKIGLPMLALAHITSDDVNNPESVRKPFGSIFWENGARRTIFVFRQQEEESPIADLGLYPRKVNDGGKPAAFGVKITFSDPSGPITVEPSPLRGNGALSRVRGAEYTIWDVLTGPKSAGDIADQTGLTERYVKQMLNDHPRMFVDLDPEITGGRGKTKRWGRLEARPKLAPPERHDELQDEVPF